MTGGKESKRDEHERKHGTAAWAPCVPCRAYGQINGVKCAQCNGIGFIPRAAQPAERNER